MDRLVQAQEREARIDFRLACKCQTTIHLKNITQSMLVAFKIQTTSPDKFSVKPPNGFILPTAELSFHVVLKPQYQLPEHFPMSKERFLVKTIVAPVSINENLPERAPGDWFTSRTRKVFLDAKLRVVYTGDLLLRYSVVKEDLASVKHILKRQICSDSVDEAGRSAIHIAAANGNMEILKVLLVAGANVNLLSNKGQTPLLEAAFMGHLEAMKLLLDYGADIEAKNFRGWTAIHLASMLNHLEIVRFLIKRGANLETKDNEARTALHCAVREGHAECVKVLMEAGVDKDACSLDGRSALFRAAAKGNVEIVRLMMDMGANADIKSKSGQSAFEVAMENGHKAVMDALCLGESLMKAAMRGDVKGVTASLKMGANVNGRDQWGWTGLHSASFKGHVEVVAKLIAYGADVREEDSGGHTALHCAVEGGHKDVAQLLVSKGADIHAKNKKGITPLQIAAALNYKSICKIFALISSSNHARLTRVMHFLNSAGVPRSNASDVRLASVNVPPEERIAMQAMNSTPRFMICEGNPVTEAVSGAKLSHPQASHLVHIHVAGPDVSSVATRSLPTRSTRSTRTCSLPRMKREAHAFVSTAESQPSSPGNGRVPHRWSRTPEFRRASVINASSSRKAQKSLYTVFDKEDGFLLCNDNGHQVGQARHVNCKPLREFLEQESF